MLLKFLEDAVYNGKVIYKKGQIYDVPTENNFAERWIKRGAQVVEQPAQVVEQQKVSANEIADEEVKRGPRGKRAIK